MNKLQQLMGSRELSSAINSPLGGLPNGFPVGFMTRTRKIRGAAASWKQYPNTRVAATVGTYGGPSQHVDNAGFSTRSAVALHSFEDQIFGQDVFNTLDSVGGGADEMGIAELQRQTADFKRRFMNLRIHALQSVLALGAIYKAGKSVLPSSSGATETIDMAVPANNKGTCNGIIGTKWDQTTATVLTDIDELQAQQVKNGNPPLRYAYYGQGVPEALIGNPVIAKLIAGSNTLADGFTNGIPDAMKMKWLPVGSMFHESASGTQTDMFSKLCVFTPDPLEGDWYEMLEGSYAVPSSPGMSADAASLASNLETRYGMFSYAEFTKNPVGIQQFAGDTFLPVLKVPSAIFIATVLT